MYVCDVDNFWFIRTHGGYVFIKNGGANIYDKKNINFFNSNCQNYVVTCEIFRDKIVHINYFFIFLNNSGNIDT